MNTEVKRINTAPDSAHHVEPPSFLVLALFNNVPSQFRLQAVL